MSVTERDLGVTAACDMSVTGSAPTLISRARARRSLFSSGIRDLCSRSLSPRSQKPFATLRAAHGSAERVPPGLSVVVGSTALAALPAEAEEPAPLRAAYLTRGGGDEPPRAGPAPADRGAVDVMNLTESAEGPGWRFNGGVDPVDLRSATEPATRPCRRAVPATARWVADRDPGPAYRTDVSSKQQFSEVTDPMAGQRAELTGHLYKRIDSIRRAYKAGNTEFTAKPCYYCGIPATDFDHVPPISMADALVTTDALNASLLVKVDACKDCNGYLGAKPLLTPEDRRREVRDHIATQIHKYRDVDWSVAEIRQLGPNMKREVRGFVTWLKTMRARLAWASAEVPISVREDQIEMTRGDQIRRAIALAEAKAETEAKAAAVAAEDVSYEFSHIAARGADRDRAVVDLSGRVDLGAHPMDVTRCHAGGDAPVAPPVTGPGAAGPSDGGAPGADVAPVRAAPLARRRAAQRPARAAGPAMVDAVHAAGGPAGAPAAASGECSCGARGAGRTLGPDPRQLDLFAGHASVTPPVDSRLLGEAVPVRSTVGAAAELGAGNASGAGHGIPLAAEDAAPPSAPDPVAPEEHAPPGAVGPEVADDDRDLQGATSAPVSGSQSAGNHVVAAVDAGARPANIRQREAGPRRAQEAEEASGRSESDDAVRMDWAGSRVPESVPPEPVGRVGAGGSRPARAAAPRKAPAKKSAKAASSPPRGDDGIMGDARLTDEPDPWGLSPEPAALPVAKAPPKKKAPSKATPEGIEWLALVDRYFKAYERVRGVKPIFTGADARAMQSHLQKNCKGDHGRAGDIIDSAFADPFWGPKVTIRDIASNPSRFAGLKSSRRFGAHMQAPAKNPDGSIKKPKLVNLDD